MARVFIIGPVRKLDAATEKAIGDYVLTLEAKGYIVYWPKRDTNQEDPIGLRICSDNREAIYQAGEVHIWFDPSSQGSVFDMGMLFALLRDTCKKVVIINRDQIFPTPQKSFENVFLELAKAS